MFHELISDKVHIDVHFVEPSADFPFKILVTSGMSALPMTVPEGAEDMRYAELGILLPSTWEFPNLVQMPTTKTTKLKTPTGPFGG